MIPGWDTPASEGMMEARPSPEELHAMLADNMIPHFDRHVILPPHQNTQNSDTLPISE